MVAPDLIPVWVGFALLGTFALLTVVASVYCGAWFVASLVNGERR